MQATGYKDGAPAGFVLDKPSITQQDADDYRGSVDYLLLEDGTQLFPTPLPTPELPEPDPFLALFKAVQEKLDGDEFKRTGKVVDSKGAVSRARAYAATAMIFHGWHYPSVADLSTPENQAILAAIYADPTNDTTEQSSNTQKRKVLQNTLVMLEGQAFGVQYVAELGAYERTASGLIRAVIANDSRDWMELGCGPYETVRAMFLAVLV
ncbi:MAG: hypothetical protein J0I12_11085 [Candidatus Eremiobacteraeota bacterium]|nr:hypothetical protein [Candidatus Eremiobacteraeota bacterium]